MIVVFVGPTLAGYAIEAPGVTFRPPAKQGDLYQAVIDGAKRIGLIDGYFEQSAAVWHKEILYALSQGVRVAGAASMGALRAAECARFGMEVVGKIAQAYLSGERCDDADVAVVSMPPECGHHLLSEPMVNIEPTLERMLIEGFLTPRQLMQTKSAMRRRHFSELQIDGLFDGCEGDSVGLSQAYWLWRVDQKAIDAQALLVHIQSAARPTAVSPWQFRTSPTWRRWIEERHNADVTPTP